MKISCPSCSAKYSVADEKIQARLAKIRCRKCSSTIVIDGTTSPATVSIAGSDAGVAAKAASAPAESDAPLSPEAAASAGEQQPSAAADPSAGEAGASGPAQGEYAVDIADNDQRNMSVGQIVTAYNEGVITAETYIWREGMSDWETLAEVPEIASALHAAAAAAPAALSPGVGGSGVGGVGVGGAGVMAPDLTGGADAGVSNEHSSTDLFGGIDRAGGEDDITTSAPDAGGYQATAGTGARNESSVLFSLSALTASEAGPTGPEAGMSASRSSDDSGLIDLQALTAADTAPVSAGGMAAGGAPGFGASPLMSAPLGGVSGPVLGGPIGGSYNKRSSTRAWILGGVGISALVLIAFAVFFKQGNIGAPSLSAETVKATTTVAEKTPAAPLPEKKAPVIAEGEEPVIPEPEAVKQPEPEPDALSAKDLAVVKAPPAKVVKKRRKAAVAKPRARRPKPAAKKPAPVKAKAPAPAPTAKPKKRKKKRKKKSCNCAPSDLMCAMQCSARKR